MQHPNVCRGDGRYVVEVESADVKWTMTRGPMLVIAFTILDGGPEPVGSRHVWTLRLPWVDEAGTHHRGHVIMLNRTSREAVLTAHYGGKGTKLNLETREKRTRVGLPFTLHEWHLGKGQAMHPKAQELSDEAERRMFLGSMV